ncbi:hypothetical protein PSEUDO8AS_50001 [Pseudomonas sp. 8AS]|nr:hypothetical protein PSEUDO8AS_50001 [Pseudomonas sp. 8AS]
MCCRVCCDSTLAGQGIRRRQGRLFDINGADNYVIYVAYL